MDGKEFNKYSDKLSNSFKTTIKTDQNKIRRYDIIYLLFHTMLMRKSVRSLYGKQKFITMVTVYPTLRPIFSRKKEIFIGVANKCEAILANNKKSLKDLQSIYKKSSYLAPRGVDPNIFYPISNEFNENKEFTVVFCGKSNPEKGLKNIIEPACKKAGVKLITNERNFTNALNEDQMREFYNEADVYIVASTMDGTPNTALEAAACGKPILSNSIGNMPEFIKNGKNGFLINLKIDKYVRKLKWMKKNRKKVYEMGLNARETILKSWTWDIVLNKNEREILRKI